MFGIVVFLALLCFLFQFRAFDYEFASFTDQLYEYDRDFPPRYMINKQLELFSYFFYRKFFILPLATHIVKNSKKLVPIYVFAVQLGVTVSF